MKALEVPIKLQSTSKKIEKDLAIQLFMNRYLFIYLKKKNAIRSKNIRFSKQRKIVKDV